MESSPPKKRSAVAVETKNGSGRKKKKVKKKNRTSGASNLPDLFTEVKKTDDKAICNAKCKFKGICKHYHCNHREQEECRYSTKFRDRTAPHARMHTDREERAIKKVATRIKQLKAKNQTRLKARIDVIPLSCFNFVIVVAAQALLTTTSCLLFPFSSCLDHHVPVTCSIYY